MQRLQRKYPQNMTLKHPLTADPKVHPRWDAFFTVAAFAAWYSGFSARASVITPACVQQPSLCDPGTLNALDRWGLVRHYDWLSDHLSYWTQDAAGLLAIVAAFLFSKGKRAGWTQLLMLLQSTIFNGVIIEAVRLAVQRPRPFVYLDPIGQGAAHAHYTSFYSGHTSFAALASTCAVLSALDAPLRARRLVMAAGLTLTLATGALRVMAGRHFITDVTFGALAGVCVALAVNSLHRKNLHADTTLA